MYMNGFASERSVDQPDISSPPVLAIIAELHERNRRPTRRPSHDEGHESVALMPAENPATRCAPECDVWIASLSDLRLPHESILDDHERSRGNAYAQPVDRARFVLGAALLRLVAATETGVAPYDVVVDRRCAQCGKQHGRPHLPGSGLHVSVSHSGELAVVAASRHTPLGVDVEEVRDIDHAALLPYVSANDTIFESARSFFTVWVRKESVVKATGAGVGMDLTRVVVSAPEDPPRLERYGGEAHAPVTASMADLALDPPYVGAVCALTSGTLAVHQHRGALVLDQVTAWRAQAP